MPPKDIENNACLVDENGDVIPLENLLNQLISNLVNNNNIGTKNDYVHIPYQPGTNSVLAHLNTNYYHTHAEGFVYPNHADAVLLTAGAGAWDLTGNITEVIPENALNLHGFDLHWINISDISGNGEIQVDLYAGTVGNEILICSIKAYRTAVQSQEGPKRIQIPQQVKGARISARLSDSTGGALTCRVSLEGHYYR